MSEQRDNTLVGVNRTALVGEDKAGRNVTLLAFTPEQTQQLVEAAQGRVSETGLLIRVATEMRTTKDGSRQFPSSFLLVMADEPRENKGGGYGQKKSTFKPKTYGNQSSAPAKGSGGAGGGYKPYSKQQTRISED